MLMRTATLLLITAIFTSTGLIVTALIFAPSTGFIRISSATTSSSAVASEESRELSVPVVLVGEVVEVFGEEWLANSDAE